MRRIVKTIDLSKSTINSIPKNAETFYTKNDDKEAVNVAIPIGKNVFVTIQTGIVLYCKIVSFKYHNNDVIYEVMQIGNDLKLKEQQKVGIPVDEKTVCNSFIAFEHQIQRA